MAEESCSRLTEIANQARDKLLKEKIYHDKSGERYDGQHPNATQAQGGVDDYNNIKGKGTGKELDTSDGGGAYDVNGRPDVIGSGRIADYKVNKYNKNNPYNCNIP